MRKLILFSILLSVTMLFATESNSFLGCSHTRTIYTEAGVIEYKENCANETSNNSRRLTSYELSVDDQNALIDFHNQLRRETAMGNTPNIPSAANMLSTVWDNALASFAQAKVDTCVWSHTSNSERTNIPGYVGQYAGENLFGAPGYPGSIETLVSGVQSWYNEYQYYTYNPFYRDDCESGQQCGHYTQLVWAKTTKIGCAYNICPTMVVNSYTLSNVVYLSCNYISGGNYVGQYPFTSGNPCGSCPSGYNTCVNGLCSSSSQTQSGPSTTKSPTLKPTTKSPTLKPTTKSPTLKPTTKSPTLKPTTKSPTLKPTTKSPTLKPTTKSPTLKPTTKSPTTKSPTLKPATKSPTTKSPTLKPTTKSPTFKPTTKSPTKKPTTKSPTTKKPTTKKPTTKSPTTKIVTQDSTQRPTTASPTQDSNCCTGRNYCGVWNNDLNYCETLRGCYIGVC